MMLSMADRSDYFQTLGNNARLTGKDSKEAEKLISTIGQKIEDFNNFWYGFHRGKNTEVKTLPDIS